ncbi:hypothetical protein OS493_037054 [Desmophyllum pertusum]|uniref:Carboxylesterase type B domain-containing protein n=1 Tax=Desmophyllum pertusum TaxID=174260 RepID=A0A9W9ZVE4_9CNID|nr:hypothetical protein OS493_037054 [Desmophyllum pertusum]
MLSPLSYGLYHKVILESGTAASTFADHPFNLLVNGKFNQTVPAIIGMTKNGGGFFVLPFKGISPGVPGIDNGLSKTEFDNLVKGGTNWVYNQTQKVVDATIFEYTDWTNITNPLVLRQKYMDVITDALFKAPAVRSAKVFVKNNLETYFYCFDYFVSPWYPPWSGVFHGADLVYVFGRPFRKYNKSASEAEQSVEITFSKQIISRWSNFAKNGKPSADVNATNWPAYTLKDEQYISLSPSSSSIQKNMLPEKMAFWNSLVPALTETTETQPPSTGTPATMRPTGEKEATCDHDKKTENALIAVVVVLVVLVLVLVAVIWSIRRKQSNALSHTGPTANSTVALTL